MIIKREEDVVGSKGDASGERWRSFRLLDEGDGTQVTLTDSILEAGFDLQSWQKNHLEACYRLEDEGTIEEIDSGAIHEIKPGALYAMYSHDRHRIKAKDQNASKLPFLSGSRQPRSPRFR